MKALTFEEWDKLSPFHFGTRDAEEYKKKVFEMSRQGMIPEDEAVRIPPVSEWPEWAEEVQVFFHGGLKGQLIESIPRPVPAWTPKVGEAVFFIYRGMVLPGIVKNILEPFNGISHGIDIIHAGTIYGVMTHEVKPFDASKIGKPWEEI